MAVPPCFHLADDVFPRVRAETARRLVDQGISQTRIAGLLHVSQAMVSKYAQRKEAEQDALVLRLADELVETLDAPASGASPWCTTLSIQQGRPGASAALDDLLAAEHRLVAAAPLAIMPEVGLNLARCLPGAQGPDDVLAYPARIVAAGDRIIRPVAPGFGASNHLAACLLALRANDASITAIANVRGGPAIRKAAGAKVQLEGTGDRAGLFAQAVASRAHRLVHDPGAVGYEPCLYIAGDSAAEVVDRIIQIANKVSP